MPRPVIWITGLGTVTPLGHDATTFARRLFAGDSGVKRIDRFDTSNHPSQIAALLDKIPVPPGLGEDEFRKLPLLEQNALWCVTNALLEAGLWDRREQLRIGLILGLGVEWQRAWENEFFAYGPLPNRDAKQPAGLLSRLQQRLGLRGPIQTVSAACASGNYALMLARRWLQLGWVDACLAGACDMNGSPLGMAGFGNLRALSRRNDEPQAASRPFDRGRDGFVLGEGGAVFVLESADAARQRGIIPWAEVAGAGARSDAFHMVIPSPDPTPAATAMKLAFADAGITPDQLNYVNCHATSTPVGDICEAKVLTLALGSAVAQVPVSSTKSMTGHLLTAAAAVEAVACLVALKHQVVPPTINLDDPDPECPLQHVAWKAQERPLRIAASNSFGFGGSNTCLILRAA